MKTVNIKLPLRTVTLLDDNAQLNPYYITDFITKYIDKEVSNEKTGRLSYYYALKVPDQLHTHIKEKAQENKLPMSEFLGRLFKSHYRL